MSAKREAAGLQPQQSVTEPELLTYRLLAQQTGSGWTCRTAQMPPASQCEAPGGCAQAITHHWIGAEGQQTWRCAHHPPWKKA